MKFLTTTIGIILLTSFFSLPGLAKAPAKFPEITHPMKDIHGNEFSFKLDKNKKGALVIFTCNHCPYAKAWMDRTIEIGNFAQGNNLQVVAINSNDPEAKPEDSLEKMRENVQKNWRSQFKQTMNYPYVMDMTSKVAKQFGATKTPEVFLYKPDGSLFYHGAIDDNSDDAKKVKNNYLRTAIDRMIINQPAKWETTKSIGCGIKFREGA